MATGGSRPSYASGSSPVEEDPTYSHGNPHPGDMGGDGDRMDTSHVLDSEDEHFKSQLDVLSKCIDQIVSQDRKKVLDRNFSKIKQLMGGLLHDDDKEIYSWMGDLTDHLSTGDDSDDENYQKAEDLRTDLHSLAVLIIDAPFSAKFPKVENDMDIVQATNICNEFNSEKKLGQVLVISMLGLDKSKQEIFLTCKYKLSKAPLWKIVNSVSSTEYEEMPYSDDVLNSNKFKVVVLHVATKDELVEAYCLGWPSTDKSEDIFSEIRKQAEPLYKTFDEDSKVGRVVADDYISCVNVIEEAKAGGRVTIQDVKTKAGLRKLIQMFMKKHGNTCPMLLVIYAGHGEQQTGNLRLEEDTVTQMFVLKELQMRQQEQTREPTICMVWGSCYSYEAIAEQENDDSIQVIPLQKTYKEVKADQYRTIRSFHLSDIHKQKVTRRKKKDKHCNLELQKFAEEQVSKKFAMSNSFSPFDIKAQSPSGKETEKPSTDEISEQMKEITLATDGTSSAPESQQIRS